MNIFSIKNGLLHYLIVWTVLIIVHTIFMNLIYNFSFIISFCDAIVFNITFAFIGVGLWFYTGYSTIKEKNKIDLLINYFGTAIFSIIIWVSFGNYILKQIFIENKDYIDFINVSISLRAVIGFLLFSVAIWLFYLLRNIEKLTWYASREATINSQLREAELKALRSQINPHFLFNSLNSIHSLIMTKPDKAGDMILKLSDLMRYSLTKQEQLVTLEEELNQIIRYLDIEKIRFSERLIINISNNYNINEIKVPSMILQPLVENAIKHGVYGTQGKITISISTIINNGFLNISIENNYDSNYQSKNKTGIGLNNIRERLSAIYFRNDLIRIVNENNLFNVTIKIPLQ